MIFVTHNRHKYEEISEAFERAGLELEWMNLEYEEIQADTTEEVSARSCRSLSSSTQGNFFLEDTGLYIESLNGFPGPYSSYVLKTIGLDGILRLLEDRDRSACFLTVISLRYGNEFKSFSGKVSGRIAESRRGSGGFGYDPIFIPGSTGKTLAEMDIHEKNTVSHRGLAVSELLKFLKAM